MNLMTNAHFDMKLAPHTPIRAKYNPTPNAREKRFHLWLMQLPCEGCQREPCGVAHHVLTDSPHKRWRRDHEMMLPLCDQCHRDLHTRYGDEEVWCLERGFEPIPQAIAYRALGRRKGLI